jgi:hypothetical protein
MSPTLSLLRFSFGSLSVALALTLGSGCGASETKLVPVEGTVKLGKEPLKSGSISFHPDSDKGNKAAQPFVGTIENGAYKVAAGEKYGAEPGWYKVTVTATVPSDPKDEYSVPKSLISEKFGDPAATPLSAEVKEGGGPYNFEVAK